MAKVYVLNRGPYDYSDAERFGELVYCTEGSLDKVDTTHMYRLLLPFMKESIPEDYILLTSLTSLCCVACAMFSYYNGRLNLLVHTAGGYIPRTIHLGG